MFTISLNTNFEEIPKDGKLTFSKNELDKANKDTKKQFPSGFIFEVYFLSQAQVRFRFSPCVLRYFFPAKN